MLLFPNWQSWGRIRQNPSSRVSTLDSMVVVEQEKNIRKKLWSTRGWVDAAHLSFDYTDISIHVSYLQRI